jgi:hypothetical protein
MRATLGALVLVAALPLVAADAPATDPLAAGARDLADVKAMASPSQTQAAGSGAKPEAAPADLPMAHAAKATLPAVAVGRDGSGTGNWLVDAMMDTKAEREALGLSPKSGKVDLKAVADAAAAKAPEEPLQKLRTEAAYNPIDAFMAGWVSARDRDLLVPAKGAEQAKVAGTAAEPVLPGGNDLTASLLAAQDSGAAADARPAGNPYLELFTASQPATVHLAPVQELPDFASPAAKATQTGLIPDPRPADASRSLIPDFAQPDDDDKYFKQMKRF